jgi:muramoyltetrapeptide carboxypeptidase LdcA involved in peptidoglycan recycling
MSPVDVTLPPPVRPGDRVAVVSASWCAPEQFPAVHEQALARVRELDLEPVEYPTTRVQGSPAERARDLMAAFSDPSIRAVMATIGGDDQITVLRHLDPARMLADPKRFLGYSDNTNLSNWLWFHGLGSVYGGSTQVHLGPGPAVDPEHLEVLRPALFGGDVELHPVPRTRDIGLAWGDPDCLTDPAPDRPAEPWTWAGPARAVTGTTWGGCLEVVEWTLAAGRWVHPPEAYGGTVLLLEPSEERPPPEECFRMLRNLGERGILGEAAALLGGRPPVGDREHRPTPDEGAARRRETREAVLRAVDDYAGDLVVALDVDFGHTSPQLPLPYGGRVTVDGEQQRVVAHFGSPV